MILALPTALIANNNDYREKAAFKAYNHYEDLDSSNYWFWPFGIYSPYNINKKNTSWDSTNYWQSLHK